MSEHDQEEAQYFLENIPSCLTGDDIVELRRRLGAMGNAEAVIEQAIADIDACLKREKLRLAQQHTLPDPQTSGIDISGLRDAAAQFLRAFTALDQHSAYLILKQLADGKRAVPLDELMTNIRWVEEACASILSNRPEGKRQKKASASFAMLKHNGKVIATPIRNMPKTDQEIAKSLRGRTFVSDDGNTTLTVRESATHDFDPVMKDIAAIWSAISDCELGRSKKGANSTAFSPVAFVQYVLSKVHDDVNDTKAETRIRDYERARASSVKFHR